MYVALLLLIMGCTKITSRSDGSSGSGGAGGGGTYTGTSSQAGTDSTTSTSTNTSTSSRTSKLPSSHPSSLTIDGQIVTADRPSDCPNNLCLLKVDSTVTTGSAGYSGNPANSSNIGTGYASVQNYFKSVCMVTPIIDLWRPISWENCTNFNTEKFYIEYIDDSYYYLHPAAAHDLCVESPGGTLAEGIQLVLQSCNRSDNQIFTNEIVGYFALIHPKLSSSLCLVRGGNSSGSLTVGLWKCSITNTNLMWNPQ